MDLVIVDITGSKITVANSNDIRTDKVYSYLFPLIAIQTEEDEVYLHEWDVDYFMENNFNYDKIYEKYLIKNTSDAVNEEWEGFIEGGALYWMSKSLPNLVPCVIYDILVFNQLGYFPINFYLWFKEIIEWMDVERWIEVYRPSDLNAQKIRIYYKKALVIISDISPEDLDPVHINLNVFPANVVCYKDIANVSKPYPRDIIYIGY